MSNENLKATGILGIRLLLGTIFFTQGFGKLFKFGFENVYGFFSEYEVLCPASFLKFIMYYTTLAELIFGIFLMLGLFRKISYIGLFSVLLIVSFGHGMKDVIWDMQHVIYRAILLIPLFLIPLHWDKYALDNIFFKKKSD